MRSIILIAFESNQKGRLQDNSDDISTVNKNLIDDANKLKVDHA